MTDAGLTHLQGLEQLKDLSLDSTQVTDSGLVHLQGLKNLRRLILDHTHVTDAGLAHLSGLKNLSELRLKGARQVGDLAIPRLLRFPLLRRIDLSDTRVSAKGLAILKASLPNGAQIAWSEPNDTTVSRAVLAAGGRVDLRVQGTTENHRAKMVNELPNESFQITGVSFAGVRQPLKEVLRSAEKAGGGDEGEIRVAEQRGHHVQE